MSEHASISSDILARYAGDAACEVAGVRGLVARPLPRQQGVRVLADESGTRIEVHIEVEWGVSIPAVGRAVQDRVHDYLVRMADLDVDVVDVVVDEIGPA